MDSKNMYLNEIDTAHFTAKYGIPEEYVQQVNVWSKQVQADYQNAINSMMANHTDERFIAKVILENIATKVPMMLDDDMKKIHEQVDRQVYLDLVTDLFYLRGL
jgi:hypothetical protein